MARRGGGHRGAHRRLSKKAAAKLHIERKHSHTTVHKTGTHTHHRRKKA